MGLKLKAGSFMAKRRKRSQAMVFVILKDVLVARAASVESRHACSRTISRA